METKMELKGKLIFDFIRFMLSWWFMKWEERCFSVMIIQNRHNISNQGPPSLAVYHTANYYYYITINEDCLHAARRLCKKSASVVIYFVYLLGGLHSQKRLVRLHSMNRMERCISPWVNWEIITNMFHVNELLDTPWDREGQDTIS